jgi:hypothetical protein
MWPATIVTLSLIGAAITAMVFQCYGFTFLFALGATLVWENRK